MQIKTDYDYFKYIPVCVTMYCMGFWVEMFPDIWHFKNKKILLSNNMIL